MENARPTILIVDDEPINIRLLMDLLNPHYRLIAARDGETALKRASEESDLDAILLDVVMPGMDGYEVCNRLKKEEATKDIPVIFVSAMGDTGDETLGLELGAADYITKPISPPIVLARLRTHVLLKRAREGLRQQNKILEERVAERTKELSLTQDITILCLASLAETRDSETGNHIRRTQFYVKALAEQLRKNPHYENDLDDKTVDQLFKSAPLHDIGKVGVPDDILLKPGKLTDEEFEIMKTHTTIGRDAILEAEEKLVEAKGELSENNFLRYAREIAYSHQEKWDGSGYPEGLSGTDIPLSARLMAVAEVYDALISKRVYKPAFSHDKAVKIILKGSGAHFDPDVIAAFEEVIDDFAEIARRFED